VERKARGREGGCCVCDPSVTELASWMNTIESGWKAMALVFVVNGECLLDRILAR